MSMELGESRKQLQILAGNTYAHMQHLAYADNDSESIFALHHDDCTCQP